MAITCTRCQGIGFLNIDEKTLDWITNHSDILEAFSEWKKLNPGTDACICDCCGNGETWYGEPGSHYTSEDPAGPHGPYAYNGGLCECH